MNGNQILDEAGIGSSGSYYSGRGATTTDLNDKKLSKIYDLLKKHHSENAAKAFVSMVAAMKVLSATAFINEFKYLERMNWVFKNTISASGIDIDSEATAFATLAWAMFGGSKRDETEAIRHDFLVRHGIRQRGNSFPDWARPEWSK